MPLKICTCWDSLHRAVTTVSVVLQWLINDIRSFPMSKPELALAHISLRAPRAPCVTSGWQRGQPSCPRSPSKLAKVLRSTAELLAATPETKVLRKDIKVSECRHFKVINALLEQLSHKKCILGNRRGEYKHLIVFIPMTAYAKNTGLYSTSEPRRLKSPGK